MPWVAVVTAPAATIAQMPRVVVQARCCDSATTPMIVPMTGSRANSVATMRVPASLRAMKSQENARATPITPATPSNGQPRLGIAAAVSTANGLNRSAETVIASASRSSPPRRGALAGGGCTIAPKRCDASVYTTRADAATSPSPMPIHGAMPWPVSETSELPRSKPTRTTPVSANAGRPRVQSRLVWAIASRQGPR